ncbi:response regulator [Methylobacterium sp. NEAU 140]|uniref:response regulator n=1 Tax=Methylobacterium sp. NEAU 140 TaxID=3064945 RepID=UPI002732444B|nr:response regulator [Methylobacterium sp. NEAU 140]MDP4026948.1 response regulator [Methylobacterium sp. NEAU 140]
MIVAEDDALLRADMARTLTAAGIAVFGVGDADEAVGALAWRSDIRVLITDVGMPSGGVNGFQLAAMVAARWPQIGILVVSGGERPQSGELPMGVRYLPKPCRSQDLVAAVFAIVSRQTGAI